MQILHLCVRHYLGVIRVGFPWSVGSGKADSQVLFIPSSQCLAPSSPPNPLTHPPVYLLMNE